ncbi:MAG: phage tail assembly chaperone [Enterovibrio sp.]
MLVDEMYRLSQELATVRSSRNLLLRQCDWTQLADVPLSDSKKLEFAQYRQQLRDITEPLKSDTATFSIGSIQWPTKPEL